MDTPFESIEARTGKHTIYEYVDQHRLGDHICYYSDLRKMRAHYPTWDVTVDLAQILDEIVQGWQKRIHDGKG